MSVGENSTSIVCAISVVEQLTISIWFYLNLLLRATFFQANERQANSQTGLLDNLKLINLCYLTDRLNN